MPAAHIALCKLIMARTKNIYSHCQTGERICLLKFESQHLTISASRLWISTIRTYVYMKNGIYSKKKMVVLFVFREKICLYHQCYGWKYVKNVMLIAYIRANILYISAVEAIRRPVSHQLCNDCSSWKLFACGNSGKDARACVFCVLFISENPLFFRFLLYKYITVLLQLHVNILLLENYNYLITAESFIPAFSRKQHK